MPGLTTEGALMYGEEGNRRIPFLIGGGLLLIFIAAAAIFFLTRSGPQTPADIEAMFEQNQADREVAHALKANFPSDYQAMLRRLADSARTNGKAAVMREAASFAERFIRSKANAIMAAPDRELQRLGGAEATLVRALHDENVTQCADYTLRGFGPNTRLSPAIVALVSRISVILIEAARAGEQSGGTPRPTLSQTDGQAWLAEVRAMNASAADQIQNHVVDRQPPAVQCEAGLAVYEAVTHLPGPTAANVTAFMIRQTLERPGS
jgi:hypothetical protein